MTIAVINGVKYTTDSVSQGDAVSIIKVASIIAGMLAKGLTVENALDNVQQSGLIDSNLRSIIQPIIKQWGIAPDRQLIQIIQPNEANSISNVKRFIGVDNWVFRQTSDSIVIDSGIVTTNPIVRGNDFLLTLEKYCHQYDIDAIAMLALALESGISGTMSVDGFGYGPFWIDLNAIDVHQLGTPTAFSESHNQWAWTDNGIQYAVRRVYYAIASGVIASSGIQQVTEILQGDKRWITDSGRLTKQYLRIIDLEENATSHIDTVAVGPPNVVTPKTVVTVQPFDSGNQPSAWRQIMTVFSSDIPSNANYVHEIAAQFLKAVQ